MKERFKLPFGLKDGRITEISEVERGLSCGCICPVCKSQLVARKGKTLGHHFAHYNSYECPGALETALHLAAKEVLGRRRYIRTPTVESRIVREEGLPVKLRGTNLIEFDSVELESRFGNIVPDLYIEVAGRKLLIEIAVTHFVEERKRAQIEALGYSALEVDLSRARRQVTFEELEKLIVDEINNKRWVFNRIQSAFEADVRAQSIERQVIARGMASHIDDCPIRIRIWRGKPYANLIDDCFLCDYLIDGRGNEFSSHTHITCVGHARSELRTIKERHTRLRENRSALPNKQ